MKLRPNSGRSFCFLVKNIIIRKFNIINTINSVFEESAMVMKIVEKNLKNVLTNRTASVIINTSKETSQRTLNRVHNFYI